MLLWINVNVNFVFYSIGLLMMAPASPTKLFQINSKVLAVKGLINIRVAEDNFPSFPSKNLINFSAIILPLFPGYCSRGLWRLERFPC